MLTLAFALTAASAGPAQDFSDEWRAVLAERRQTNIERLEAYASEGRYPLNLDQPGPAHMFMDDSGSRCGMAELIWQSGHEALVVETYQSRNDAVMAELELSDPLTDWVVLSGLTMGEVAFIQEPGFMVRQMELMELQPIELEEPVPDPDLVALEQQRRSAHFAMAARQLRMTTGDSLDLAVAALGQRVQEPPGELAWSSDLSHRTKLPRRLATRR